MTAMEDDVRLSLSSTERSRGHSRRGRSSRLLPHVVETQADLF